MDWKSTITDPGMKGLEVGLAMWDTCLCVCICAITTLSFTSSVQTLFSETWKKLPRCTQCHYCMIDIPASLFVLHCDRWPCEFFLFRTPPPALHIDKRNSSGACKKELWECGSRGHCFPRPEDCCSLGGRTLLDRYRRKKITVYNSEITSRIEIGNYN